MVGRISFAGSADTVQDEGGSVVQIKFTAVCSAFSLRGKGTG
jgi:hypothetical protein